MATDRLLNTAEIPSPNSNSGEEFRGVFQTDPSPGSGMEVGGFMMEDKRFMSAGGKESLLSTSRNSST